MVPIDDAAARTVAIDDATARIVPIDNDVQVHI
jgi:hypothetical protein